MFVIILATDGFSCQEGKSNKSLLVAKNGIINCRFFLTKTKRRRILRITEQSFEQKMFSSG